MYKLTLALKKLYLGTNITNFGPKANDSISYTDFAYFWPPESGPVPTEQQLQQAYNSIPTTDFHKLYTDFKQISQWEQLEQDCPILPSLCNSFLLNFEQNSCPIEASQKLKNIFSILKQIGSPNFLQQVIDIAEENAVPEEVVDLLR